MTKLFSALLDFIFPAEESVREFAGTGTGSVDELERMLPAYEPSNLPKNIECLFAYSDERVKHLVWEIKYYKNERIADVIGQLLAKKILADAKAQVAEKFLLIPIPQTARRQRERGFNHTEMIANAVIKHLPSNFSVAVDTLRKIRHTPKQSSLENRQERLTNLVGAFVVTEPAKILNRNILVIDDVVTTGATIMEAVRVLQSAGVKEIRGFAIAH